MARLILRPGSELEFDLFADRVEQVDGVNIRSKELGYLDLIGSAEKLSIIRVLAEMDGWRSMWWNPKEDT